MVKSKLKFKAKPSKLKKVITRKNSSPTFPKVGIKKPVKKVTISSRNQGKLKNIKKVNDNRIAVSQLADLVSSRYDFRSNTSISKKEIMLVVYQLLETVKEELQEGKIILFKGYFSLFTAIRKGKAGVNFYTGKKMRYPDKLVPKVKFATGLKDAIGNY